MAYTRACPLCRAAYPAGVPDLGHLTLASRPGGTPSPSRPELPGRDLSLRCTPCGGTFAWDYFADAAAALQARPHPAAEPAGEEAADLLRRARERLRAG